MARLQCPNRKCGEYRIREVGWRPTLGSIGLALLVVFAMVLLYTASALVSEAPLLRRLPYLEVLIGIFASLIGIGALFAYLGFRRGGRRKYRCRVCGEEWRA
jgi:ABC-type long-subunit fatty acid transport system fused permease/ATPase subunit